MTEGLLADATEGLLIATGPCEVVWGNCTGAVGCKGVLSRGGGAGPTFGGLFSSVFSTIDERDGTLGPRNRDKPRGLLMGDLGSSAPWTRDTFLRREARAGDGAAFRSLFVVALMRFFPCLYSTYRVRHSGTIRSSRFLANFIAGRCRTSTREKAAEMSPGGANES